MRTVHLYLNEILNHFLLFWLLEPSLMRQEWFALPTFPQTEATIYTMFWKILSMWESF